MSGEGIRTRYAPSPTGHLHIGGARTALFSYLLAKKERGKFVLRIEDTDAERNIFDAEQRMLDSLAWLGLNWDESVDVGGPYEPYRSMDRLETYRSYLHQLLENGQAYDCYCTKEELEEERESQIKKGEMPRYSGRCRTLTEEEVQRFKAEGRRPSVRFRVPENERVVVHDVVRGKVEFDTNGIGDFVIARPDGRPMYNFAVTVDDALMHITHVIRGEEHLSNTPLQVLLYQALGFPVPQFAHASLILNQDRQKMSKRDESIIQFVDQYRELGYLPEALVNFLVLLGWAPGGDRAEDEFFSLDELIDLFSLDRVSKAPAVFDPEKLNWMNNHYIKQCDSERLMSLCVPHLEAAGLISREPSEDEVDWVRRMIMLYREQMRYGAEIVSLSEMFFQDKPVYSKEAAHVLAESQVLDVLQAFREQIAQLSMLNADTLQQTFKATQKATGQKGKKLFMPVRAALTGQVHGPDLKESLSLIGREKVTARLQHVIDNYDRIVSK